MVIVFDIDGTLINSGGAGARSFERAFKELYGLEGVMKGYKTYGKTDTFIAYELLEINLGRKPKWREVRAVLEKYIKYLAEEIKKSEGYRVLPGVKEAFEKLSGRDNVILGLATGNLEEGAKLKLGRAGLFKYFKFGAYGDTLNRTEVLKKAREIGLKFIKERGLKNSRIIAVGDTPLDIVSAREAGLEVVAVATGIPSIKELERYEPDLLVKTLKDPEFWEFLGLPEL